MTIRVIADEKIGTFAMKRTSNEVFALGTVQLSLEITESELGEVNMDRIYAVVRDLFFTSVIEDANRRFADAPEFDEEEAKTTSVVSSYSFKLSSGIVEVHATLEIDRPVKEGKMLSILTHNFVHMHSISKLIEVEVNPPASPFAFIENLLLGAGSKPIRISSLDELKEHVPDFIFNEIKDMTSQGGPLAGLFAPQDH